MSAPSAGPGHARATDDTPTTGALATGPATGLRVAGALAVGPDGALYGADVARHRVLVGLPDDHFGVDEIPGDGGFEARQQLIAVRAAQVTLLWQQGNHGHGDRFGRS